MNGIKITPEQMAEIEAIYTEISELLGEHPMRQALDVDVDQLCTVWKKPETTVRRIMKALDKKKDISGYCMLKVYDPDKARDVLVVRRYTPPSQRDT